MKGLRCFCDTNWGGVSSTLTHGYVLFLFGCPIGWMSRHQGFVTTLTCHAEYMSSGTAAREKVWVINVWEELIGQCEKATVYCDNMAAVKVEMDLHLTKRSHHMARKFHYVNEQIYNQVLQVVWIDGAHQRANIMIKPLGHILFIFFKELVGMSGVHHW